MKTCPFCAEEIKDTAIKCKHCNQWLSDKNSADSKSKQTPPRIACADGNCTGAIKEDGKCGYCGKSPEQVKQDLQSEVKLVPPKKKATPPKSYGSLIVIAVIGGILLVSLYPDILKSNKSVTSSQIKQQAQTKKEKTEKIVTIQTGKLSDTYESLNGSNFKLKKKDGTVDERVNDIEELAKDWVFYRQKIIKADVSGDFKDLKKYQAAFQQVNRWLDTYDANDVSYMIDRFD